MRTWLTLGGLAAFTACALAQPVSFRYFYDDANELFRVLDSTGTLIEYDYDAGGNITQVNRSTIAPASLAILNVTPLSGVAGQTVTIYGQNFSTTAASDLVQFGGVTATVVSASSGALVVQIPAAFSNGQITVTVNGVTASSGTVSLIPPPSITSIAPLYGDIGQTVDGVVIQGSNLSGAVFSLSGGGTITPVSLANTQATVNIVLGQTPGTYVMTAATNSGTSSSLTGAGNFFIVYNSPGNNYSDSVFSTFNATGSTPLFPPGTNYTDSTFSVFNAMGSTPDFPPGTSYTDSTFSVFNAMGSTPDFPPGTSYTDATFSVFNATGSTPDFPPGTNYSDSTFSVFNAMGSTPLFPAGSNLAWQLFSTMNTESGTAAAPMAIAVTRAGRPIAPAAAPEELPLGIRPPLDLMAGETVQISVQPPQLLHNLEIDVDKAALGVSNTGSLNLPLTAPFGVDSFAVASFGFTTSGAIFDSLVETIRVSADPGRAITGQVVDSRGSPVPGAVVTWEAQGLAAEYYRFGGELDGVPKLNGLPARTSFLGALDYPNPRQVFGRDPMGVGLGANYAARLAGKIQIPAAGLYQFSLLAHAGARLEIDGQLIAEATATGADAVTASGSVSLEAGVHNLEVTHFESGGAAALELLWTPPGGVESVVPPSAITAEAPPFWRAVTGSDGRFVLHAPAALDGVVVKLVTGEGTVQLDR